MPYTMEDFKRDYAREYVDRLTPEERLKGLPSDEILKRIPAEERLKGLPDEELMELIKKRFSKEKLQKLLEAQNKNSDN